MEDIGPSGRRGFHLVPGTMRGILVTLIVVLATPIFILEAVLHYDRLGGQRQHETQANVELARAVAEHMQAFVSDIERKELLLGVSLASEERSMSGEESLWILLNAAGSRPAVGYIAWLDPKGRVKSASDPGRIGDDLADQICLQALSPKTDMCVTDPVSIQGGSAFFIVKAIHIREASLRGEEVPTVLAGIVVAWVDAAWLGEEMKIERSRMGSILMVDSGGRPVYQHPVRESAGSSQLDRNPLVARALSGEESMGSFFFESGTSEHLAGFAPIAPIGWAVGAYRPAQQITDALVEDYFRETSLYFAVTVFAVLFGLLISRALTMPMQRLREHALAIGRGETGARVRVDRPAELATLAQAFNRMAKEIEVRQAEEQAYMVEIEEAQESLRRARDELEDRVHERTAALAASEERFRSVMETAVNAIILVDDHGKVLFWNRAATRLFGYSDVEMVGGALAPIVPERLYAEYRDSAARMLAGDRSISLGGMIELVGRRKDGSEFPAELSLGTTKTVRDTVFTAIIRDLTRRKQADEHLRQSVVTMRRVLEQTVQAMAMTVETRDPYTAGHQRRVAELASAIAKKMGLSEDEVATIRLAATIHDIGKISVPAEILVKPGRITDWEFALIKGHPQIGYDVLKTIEFPWPIARIVHEHHERLDGSGYPSGLRGEDILLEAKIVAVADVVEAMASHRPYRPALGVEEALQEISQNSGVLYDPHVVSACLRVFDEGFKWE